MPPCCLLKMSPNPGNLSPHPWECSKKTWMWHLGTWFGGGHGGVGLLVGLDDPGGVFQLE